MASMANGQGTVTPGTHNALLLEILSDGKPHSQAEILRYAVQATGEGMTVHSRAADLRKAGYRVVNSKTGRGSKGSWYSLDEGAVSSSVPAPSSSEQTSGVVHASARSLLASGMQPSAPPPETPDAEHSFEQLRLTA